MADKNIRKIIKEELTKTQVEKIIDDKVEKEYKNKAFEENVRKIVSDVLDDFFKNLWARNNFWKTFLKK